LKDWQPEPVIHKIVQSIAS